MDWSTLPSIALRLFVLLAGLLLPGALTLRALSLPRSLAGSFLLSGAILYLNVLALAVVHGPITWLTLATGPVLVSLLCLWRSARPREEEVPVLAPTPLFPYFTELGRWLPLLLLVLGIVGWRLALDPLSGPDAGSRWSFLAEQMLRVGNLNFYPAQSSADFLRYYWPESIPPGIASLSTWAYACGGGTQPAWTTPVVALEFLSGLEFIWLLAFARSGKTAARWAVLLAAACPLLLWSFLPGQESGLLTTALVGLVFYLDRLSDGGGGRWLIPAAAAALVAASTREYGFLFAFGAVAALVTHPVGRVQTRRFALLALPAALLWPLHCWVKTGSPFPGQYFGGAFRFNQVYLDWTRLFLVRQYSLLQSPHDWLVLGRSLLWWALPAWAGLFFLFAHRSRGWRRSALFVCLVAGLWYAAVPLTPGGLVFSLRLLGPACALLIIAAAITLAERLPRPSPRWWVALLLVLSLEALPKLLVFPENPYRLAPTEWPAAARRVKPDAGAVTSELLAKLTSLPAETVVVTDNFELPAPAARAGRSVAPFWTPDFAWFFDRSLSPESANRHRQDSGIRLLLVSQTGPTLGYLKQYGNWTNPYYSLRVAGITANHFLLEFVPKKTVAPLGGN